MVPKQDEGNQKDDTGGQEKQASNQRQRIAGLNRRSSEEQGGDHKEDPPAKGTGSDQLSRILQTARSRMACSSTLAPASTSAAVTFSASLWLMPPSQGMKIMPVGATRET